MIRPQVFRKTFPGVPESAADARQFAAVAMGGSPAADGVVLAVSELAANAVRWSRSGDPGGWYVVRLAVTPLSHAAVYVGDLGPAAGRCAPPSSEGGRGLRIVASIAEAWGVTRCGGSASAGPVRGEPAEAARVAGTAWQQCVWFRVGWQAAEPAGAEPGRLAVSLEVMRRAGWRCECTGMCGRSHSGGRCHAEHQYGRPLHAVPLWPAGTAAAARLPAALLIALCAPCHDGNARIAERAPAATAGASLFDPPPPPGPPPAERALMLAWPRDGSST